MFRCDSRCIVWASANLPTKRQSPKQESESSRQGQLCFPLCHYCTSLTRGTSPSAFSSGIESRIVRR